MIESIKNFLNKFKLEIILFLTFIFSNLYDVNFFSRRTAILTQFRYDSQIRNLWNDGMYLFYKALNYLIYAVSPRHNFFYLLPSIIISLLTVIISYVILNKWHGKIIGFLGSLLLVSSPILLHLGRIQDYEINYILIIPIIYFIYLLTRITVDNRITYLIFFLYGVILLIPGGIFFVLLSVYLNKKILKSLVTNNFNFIKSILLLFFGFYWIPLVINYLSEKSSNYLNLLGISGFSNVNYKDLYTYFKPFNQVFVYGINRPTIWLHGTPLIDGSITILFVLGLYFYFRNLKANRTKLIFGTLILSYLLSILNTNFIFVFSIAVIFIAISGLHSLILLWNKYFPINKVAKGFAYSLIFILIFISLIYNYRSYFVAWKYSQNSIVSFDLKPKN